MANTMDLVDQLGALGMTEYES